MKFSQPAQIEQNLNPIPLNQASQQNLFNIVGGVLPHSPSKFKMNQIHKQSNQTNSNQNISPENIKNNLRQRSNTVKAEQTNQIISLKKVKASDNCKNQIDSKTLSSKKFQSNSSSQSSKLSSPKPAQFQILVQENQKLKESICMLTKLIQEVVPAFTQMNTESSTYCQTKTQSQETKPSPLKYGNSPFLQTFGNLSNNKGRALTQDQLGFLQQSLQQLQTAYQQKQEENALLSDSDSSFLLAEDLDMGQLDEKVATTLSPFSSSKTNQSNVQSFLTFGGNKNENEALNKQVLRQNQISNFGGGLRINQNSSQKTKISDLNKQSKNFNMPVCIKKELSQKKIIDYEGVKQLQGMIDNINKSEILQELKLIQPNPHKSTIREDYNKTLSRNNQNMILSSNYSSVNISGDSNISDDDQSSIPTDSLLHKNILANHQTISKQNLLQDLNSQPFNKFSMGNMHQTQQKDYKFQENLGSLVIETINKQKPQNKQLQMFYPKILEGTQNFYSCTSVESHDDLQTLEAELIKNIQPQIIENQKDQKIRNNQILQITQSDHQTLNYEIINHNNNQVMPQMFDASNNFSSHISQINIQTEIQCQEQQKSKQVQIQETEIVKKEIPLNNIDFVEEKMNQQETLVRDLKFQQFMKGTIDFKANFDEQLNNQPVHKICQDFISEEIVLQSKDCSNFTQSGVQVEQIGDSSKRNSVDPFLQALMSNESPLKERQVNDSIQQSDRNDFGQAIGGFEDTQKQIEIEIFDDEIKKKFHSDQLSNEKKSRKASSRKNKENIEIISDFSRFASTRQKEPFQLIKQEFNLNNQAENYGSSTARILHSSSNKGSIMSSCNSSPISKQSKQNSQSINGYKRVSIFLKNDEQAKNQQVTLKQINEKAQPNFDLIQNKWISLEEKERELAKLNQEIIQRAEQVKKKESDELIKLDFVTNINVFDISPQQQIQQTPQLIQNNGLKQESQIDNMNFSSFNMTVSINGILDKTNKKRESNEYSEQKFAQQETQVIKEKEESNLVIENFEISPIVQSHSISMQNESSRACPIIKSSLFMQNIVESKRNTKALPSTKELSFNQTLNGFQDAIEDFKIDSENYLNVCSNQIQIECKQQRSSRDKFIQNYQIHHQEQLINELDRLSTPSPRDIKQVLYEAPQPMIGIPLLRDTPQLQIEQVSSNRYDCNTSFNDYNLQDIPGLKECTQESLTYKSSQLDNMMNDYLKDCAIKNRQSIQSQSKSQNRSPSPNNQIRSQYSSGEFVEIKAPELGENNKRKSLQNLINFTKSQNIYEYQNKIINQEISIQQSQEQKYPNYHNAHIQSHQSEPLPQSQQQIPEQVFECPSKSQSQNTTQSPINLKDNSTIKEEPSFEEQDSMSNLRVYNRHNNSIMQSQRLQLIQQQLTESQMREEANQSSKEISLTHIDMIESEIFSNYLSGKTLSNQGQNYDSNKQKDNQIQKEDQQEQKDKEDSKESQKTPLRAYINIGSQSSLQSSPKNDETCRNSIANKSNFFSPILKQLRDRQSSQSKSPNKNNDPNKSIDRNSIPSKIQPPTQYNKEKAYFSIQQKKENNEILQENQLQVQTDNQQKSQNQNEQLLKNQSLTRSNQKIKPQQVIFNSAIKNKQNSLNSQNYQSQNQQVLNSDQKLYSTNNASIKRNERETSRQRELEARLQEKEEKIKQILLKKKQTEEKLQEQRIAREMKESRSGQSQEINNSISLKTLKSNEKPKQLSLTRGSLVLLKTPSKGLQQKMVLKKDILNTVKKELINSQSTQQISKQQSSILTQITQDQSLRTLDHNLMSAQSVKNLKTNIQDPSFQVVEHNYYNLVAPISERTYTQSNLNIAQRDVLGVSPMIIKMQPTLKQKEFFQKIESDITLRKNHQQLVKSINSHSRLEQMNHRIRQSQQKPQTNPAQQNL